MAINQEIKNLVKDICDKYHISQKELANRIGKDSNYLSDVVNGRYKNVDKIKNAILSTFPQDANIQNVENSVVHGNVHQDNRKYYSDSPDVLKAQISQLETVISDKEEQVRTLTEQVRTLTEQVRTLTSSLAKKDEQISKLIEKIK
ncbi:MAG: hypothetical protein K5860_06440 [Bacteroidales bacterium]|nr:hypothetical protein [Bacteroidales bacterium]